MFAKFLACCLAILAALWWLGFDYHAAKDSVTGAADGNAATLTGQADSDWG
ncbi:MAG TPA: hypothetical protein VEB68_00065 [Croceibacterium sp.]|nr:hypothetical protein [Croceibacterium sp.]